MVNKKGHHRFDILIKTKTTKREKINTRRNRCHTRNLNLFINQQLYSMVTEKRGRKPVSPEKKKIAVQIYLEQQCIDKLGGIDTTKSKLLNYIKRHEKTIRNSKLEA